MKRKILANYGLHYLLILKKKAAIYKQRSICQTSPTLGLNRLNHHVQQRLPFINLILKEVTAIQMAVCMPERFFLNLEKWRKTKSSRGGLVKTKVKWLPIIYITNLTTPVEHVRQVFNRIALAANVQVFCEPTNFKV